MQNPPFIVSRGEWLVTRKQGWRGAPATRVLDLR
jgi:hypothetical protein